MIGAKFPFDRGVSLLQEWERFRQPVNRVVQRSEVLQDPERNEVFGAELFRADIAAPLQNLDRLAPFARIAQSNGEIARRTQREWMIGAALFDLKIPDLLQQADSLGRLAELDVDARQGIDR